MARQTNRTTRVAKLALLALLLTLASSLPVFADTWIPGQEITYTQTDWGNGGSAATLLANNYITVYPSTVVLIGEASGGFGAVFDNAGSILIFLPASGPPDQLRDNYFDPTATSGGALVGDVLALQLDVNFSDAGVTAGSLAVPFGDLVVENFDTKDNGLTVRQILADANTDLGGGASPLFIPDLLGLVPSLTASFEGGTPSLFAQKDLVLPNTTGNGGGNSVPEPSSLALLAAGLLPLLGYRRRASRVSTQSQSIKEEI